MRLKSLCSPGNPAAIYSIGQFVPFLVLLPVAIVLSFASKTWLQVLYVILGYAAICGMLYLRLYLASLSRHFTITTQRIMIEDGLLSKTQESLELFRIDHFELNKPITWRPFGYMSLRLFTSDAELPKSPDLGYPKPGTTRPHFARMPIARARQKGPYDVREGLGFYGLVPPRCLSSYFNPAPSPLLCARNMPVEVGIAVPNMESITRSNAL
jgi:hypothetical protein